MNFIFFFISKKYGLPPGSACLWSKARPWEPHLDVAASLVLWLPPSPVFGLISWYLVARFAQQTTTRFGIFMIDKIIHNHPFEIFLIEGQGMAGLGVCAKCGRRWGLLEGVCILWFFKDKTFMLIIDFCTCWRFLKRQFTYRKRTDHVAFLLEYSPKVYQSTEQVYYYA